MANMVADDVQEPCEEIPKKENKYLKSKIILTTQIKSHKMTHPEHVEDRADPTHR